MLFCSRLCRNYYAISRDTSRIMNKTSKCVPAVCKNRPNLENRSNLSSIHDHDTTTFQVLPTPVKSESDKKEYRVIRLANGLTACLISDKSPIPNEEAMEQSDYGESESEGSSMSEDEDSEGSQESSVSMEETLDEGRPKSKKPMSEQKMAAAGLCIGVGSFSDPKEVPGMAHFLEHMVFMGSEKYPKENDFDEFIKLNGGTDNASTDAETTVFYFECLDKLLAESLDRFSQFFISPLMKREAMTREREAIESEFQISVTSDGSRKEQLICGLAKKGSPVNSFPWGNLITLQDNIKDEDLYKGVHEFRKRHYSAHRMTLAIQARLTLKELEQLALQCFSGVPTNNLPPDDFSQLLYKSVFETPEFNKLYYYKPVKDLCQVDITWALPSLIGKYKSKPQHFLSYLLGDEGMGSLLSYLKKRMWVIGTSVGNGETGIEHNTMYTFFTINLNLTDEGYDHINDVVEAVFSYIRMLKESGPQQRIFNELQAITKLSFKYAPEDTAADFVENICEAMQVYPPEDYITGSELYFEYDPEIIGMLIEQMTPDKANIMIVSHKVDKGIQFDMTEKWFGTQYTVRDIPKEWMEQWNNAKLTPELSLPPPNTFITKDFTILPDIVNNPEYPEKILDSPLMEIWYRRDMKFKLPNAFYYFYLISPLSNRDAKHLCMLDMLVNLLTINISEEIYPASSADLSHAFIAFERGLIVKVWGFNEKLPVLLNLIVKYFINLSDDIGEEMFRAIKDKLLKNYYNKLLKPAGLAKDMRLNLIADHNWHPVDRYSAMLDVDFADMKKYTKDFFQSLYVKALVQGNITQEMTLNTVNELLQKLNFKELKKEDRPQYKVWRVNKGEQCCRIKSFNKNDPNSIVTNYYQSDYFTIQNSVILDLIMMVIEEPLFDILRTKEQLGYHVYSTVRDTFGVLGYTITVNGQATKTTTQYVDERIEAFLNHTQKLLADLDDEGYQKIRDNLIKMKRCTDIHLKEEVDRSWSEITSGDYIFDRTKQEIDAIEQTELKTIQSWWDSHNSFGNKENFRKLSIQVVGFKDVTTEDLKQPSRGENLKVVFLGNEEECISEQREKKYFIKGIQEYKESIELFNTK